MTVGSSTATINWAPSDAQGTGNINFLPSGSTATYVGGSGLTDFTVLNRIVPSDATRAIELNGSVLSKLAGGATGGDVPGVVTVTHVPLGRQTDCSVEELAAASGAICA